MGAFFECYVASSLHGPLRERMLPSGMPDKDQCCAACCCTLCSLSQIANEMELRKRAGQPIYQRPALQQAPQQQIVYVQAPPGQVMASAPQATYGQPVYANAPPPGKAY